jgi:mono/diheme cytochrome c family protein
MRVNRGVGLAAAIGLLAFGASPAKQAPPARPVTGYFTDANDRTTVILGQRLYLDHCAGCHGRRRQGQSLWQVVDAYAGRRAPAFDETGDIWRRSDAAILHMTKYGRYAAAPRGTSYMPAFNGVLRDREILAITAFIKAGWPIGLRIAQAMLNPGFAGMPAGANDTAWRLPPSCNAILAGSEARAQRPR